MVTFAEAMEMEQGEYIAPEEARLNPQAVIAADMGALVITSRTSKHPVAATGMLGDCLGIGIENMENGATGIFHGYRFRVEGLKKMIGLMRDSPDDTLHIHLIGGLDDTEEWKQEMQEILRVINGDEHCELVTCDIGHKPHPVGFAFVPGDTGNMLVRLSPDVHDDNDVEEALNLCSTDYFTIHRRQSAVDCPSPGKDFESSAAEPFVVTWDGREAGNQMSTPTASRVTQGRNRNKDKLR